MKAATFFALLLVSANAFNAPLFATRAVGKAPATKAVAKKAPAKKLFGKKAPVKKVAVKKAAAKKPAFQLKGATAVRRHSGLAKCLATDADAVSWLLWFPTEDLLKEVKVDFLTNSVVRCSSLCSISGFFVSKFIVDILLSLIDWTYRASLLLRARDTLPSLKRRKASSSERERSLVEPPERPSYLSSSTLPSTPNLLLASTTKRPLKLARLHKPKNSFTMMVLPCSNASRKRPSLLSWPDLHDPRLRLKLLVMTLKLQNTHSGFLPIVSSSFSSRSSLFSPLSDVCPEVFNWINSICFPLKQMLSDCIYQICVRCEPVCLGKWMTVCQTLSLPLRACARHLCGRSAMKW